MNTTPTSPVKGRLHPLMILAALAVLLFCMIGTAAIMGWIPSSIGGNANRQLSEADRVALAAALRAAVGSIKNGVRRRPRAAGEEDDALFIG